METILEKTINRKSLFSFILGMLIVLSFKIIWAYSYSICIRDALGKETCIEDPNTMIQDVIDQASFDDTIILGEGTYKESYIFLKEGISLIAREKDLGSVIVSGDPNDPDDTVIGTSGYNSIKNLVICNGEAGILIWSQLPSFAPPSNITIEHNLIINNSFGLIIQEDSENIRIVGNTIARNRERGIWISINPNKPVLWLKENIIAFNDKGVGIEFSQQDGPFSGIPTYFDLSNVFLLYNDFYDKLYQTCSYIDTNQTDSKELKLENLGFGNISKNPYFVEANRGDYNLFSYSPCIDKGDPNSDFSLEPENNGKRINLGFFGNSSQAKQTCDKDADGLLDFQEGPGDLDHDGLLDYMDGDTIIFSLTSEYDKISIHLEGIIWDTNQKIQFEEARIISPTDLLIDPPQGTLPFEVIQYNIVNLNELEGAKIKMVLPRDKIGQSYNSLIINHHIRYMALSSNFEWKSVPFDIDPNTLHDINENIIFFRIGDGRTGDTDGMRNGIIEHMATFVIDPQPLTKWHEPSDCFLSAISP